ncbi:MAG: heme ABC exporter ATP-binding protein CcmA [Chloroflexi bacterium]|nr:heme ABC exporter ATP-binding protein CcmA [Chloroflexota bacterium]
MLPFAIKVSGLTKTYGVKPVLHGLDLEVKAGQRFVLFGGNGSGKTTLLKCLAGLARPDAGDVAIAGMDARRQGPEARRLIGVVTHQPLLYEDMTGLENLRFYGRMFQTPRLEERIQQVAAQLDAAPLLSARVRTLSHGMKKRLSLCRALLHNPPVLLLDEPETGLDEEALRLLDALLTSEEGRGRTVLMATHSLERGLALADSVGVLSGGRIAYQAEAKGLDVAGFRQTYHSYLGVGQ